VSAKVKLEARHNLRIEDEAIRNVCNTQSHLRFELQTHRIRDKCINQTAIEVIDNVFKKATELIPED